MITKENQMVGFENKNNYREVIAEYINEHYNETYTVDTSMSLSSLKWTARWYDIKNVSKFKKQDKESLVSMIMEKINKKHAIKTDNDLTAFFNNPPPHCVCIKVKEDEHEIVEKIDIDCVFYYDNKYYHFTLETDDCYCSNCRIGKNDIFTLEIIDYCSKIYTDLYLKYDIYEKEYYDNNTDCNYNYIMKSNLQNNEQNLYILPFPEDKSMDMYKPFALLIEYDNN